LPNALSHSRQAATLQRGLRLLSSAVPLGVVLPKQLSPLLITGTPGESYRRCRKPAEQYSGLLGPVLQSLLCASLLHLRLSLQLAPGMHPLTCVNTAGAHPKQFATQAEPAGTQ